MAVWMVELLVSLDVVQDRTEEEEQKPEANYLIAERPTGWHSR
jgi:hypothetical protein